MAFFFTMIFVALVFWRPQEWLFTFLYGWPLLDSIVFMAALGLMLEIDEGKIRIPKRSPQLYLVGGLWFASVMSHVAHTYFAGMMATIPLVFKSCFFTALLICVLDRPKRMRRLIQLMVAMVVFMAVHAILQEVRGYGFRGMPPIHIGAGYGKAAHTRSYFFGIFGDPNDLAQILAVGIPLCFVVFRKRSMLNFLVSCLLAILLVRGILTTGSRGGMIALAATVGVMGILLFPARWVPWLLVCSIVGGLLLCPLASPFIDESAHDRIMLWGQANWAFKSSPLFGVGTNMINEFTDESRAVHNAFVLCYAEIGVFGYWFWFNLILVGFLGAWRARISLEKAKDPDRKWVYRTAGMGIAALTGYAASAYFLSRAFVYPFFFLIALLATIPVVASKMLPDDHPPLIRVRRDIYVLGTLGTLFSITYVYISIILLNKTPYIGY